MSISKVRFSRCAQVSGAVGGSVWALGACVGLTGCFADVVFESLGRTKTRQRQRDTLCRTQGHSYLCLDGTDAT